MVADPSAGRNPVGAVRADRKEVAEFFAADVPPGCAASVLEVAEQAQREMDLARYAILTRLAGMEAEGALLEAGGQRSVQAWS
ncbi:hypothetical protein DSY14_20565 [Nocardiopsis sp. MG754419]|nr:hypothetical protein [Nocardiopsis sp. MG754419]